MAGKKHIRKGGKRVFRMSEAERRRTRKYNRAWRLQRKAALAAIAAAQDKPAAPSQAELDAGMALLQRAAKRAPFPPVPEAVAAVGLEPTVPPEGVMGIENFPVARILRTGDGQIVLLDGRGAAVVLRLLEGVPGQIAIAPMPESWVRPGTDPKGVDVKDVRGVVTL